MKNDLFRSALFVLMLFVFHTANAQDTIYKINKETIVAKVLEINLETIVYKDFDNLDGPTIMIDKALVMKIVYANGKTFFIEKNEYSVAQDVDVRNKKQAVKFEFFSPITNDICFGYERMIRVGLNIETKIGIIGPGVTRSDRNATGFFLKAGVKFLPGSDYVVRGMEYAHGMRGRYIKPEFIFSNFTDDYSSSNNNTFARTSYTNYAINIVFGKQSILGKAVTFDYYIGIGYGWQTTGATNNSQYDYLVYNPYVYSHVFFGRNFPMIMTGGLTIGYLF